MVSRVRQVGEVYVVGPDGPEAGEDLREGRDDEVLGVDLAGHGRRARDGPGRVDLVLRVRSVQEGLPALAGDVLGRAGLQHQGAAAATAQADAAASGRRRRGSLAELVRRVVDIETEKIQLLLIISYSRYEYSAV